MSLQRGGATNHRLRLRTAERFHVTADRVLRWVGRPNRCEVHRLAPDARDEVRDDRPVRLALHDNALEVLEAAKADKLELDAIHNALVLDGRTATGMGCRLLHAYF